MSAGDEKGIDMTALLCSKKGPRASTLTKEYNDFNQYEQAVIDALYHSPSSLKIKEIMLANDWELLGKTKGDSRVRNNLRRPMRTGWINQSTGGRGGRYELTAFAESKLGPNLVTTSTPIPVHAPSPQPLTKSDVRDMDAVTKVKKADCTLYNACLDQAISGKWAGFSCEGCSAYVEPDPFQKMMNHTRLRALDMASELLEKTGSVCRVRGVKPGPDAKRTRRVTETVSLHELLED